MARGGRPRRASGRDHHGGAAREPRARSFAPRHQGRSGELRNATRADITELRNASEADIAELRTATKADIAELRSEMERWIGELRGEMELRFAGLRKEMDLRFSAMQGEIDRRFAALDGTLAVLQAELGSLQWLVGGIGFGILLLVIRSFWPGLG